MFAMELLGYVPVLASLALGVIFLTTVGGRVVLKAAGSAVFLGAAYLQFLSDHALVGLLLQISLALTLELRRRMEVGL